MTERQAKRQLTKMLRSFTTGSVFHLLADLQREAADEARQNDDAVGYRQAKLLEHTLFVVGVGVDAVRPA